jgi:hypothetical protein
VKNWEKILTKGLPIAVRVLREVIQGLADGNSNEEIRQRASNPGVILDEELDQLRDDEDDLLNFIKTGK